MSQQALFHGLIVPEGSEYALKKKTVKNWEWEDQAKELRANGWHPVPASRYREGNSDIIEFEGWVLVERRQEKN